jgi:hypothetical protein
VKRALLAAAAALVLAAPAAARLPVFEHGSSIGEGLPLKAYATINPSVHLFGDSITAKIAIVADTKLVDPTRLQVSTDFAPYAQATAPTIVRLRIGRFAQVTWTWTLDCLTVKCVPRVPPSDKFHVFRFDPARITYLQINRKPAYSINASWPPVEVLSQVSPGVEAFLQKNSSLNWRLGMTPVAAPTYRLSPSLLFWLAIGVAGVFGLAALGLTWRWYLVVRPRRAAPLPVDPATEGIRARSRRARRRARGRAHDNRARARVVAAHA